MFIPYVIRIKIYNAPGFFRGLNDMPNRKLWCKL